MQYCAAFFASVVLPASAAASSSVQQSPIFTQQDYLNAIAARKAVLATGAPDCSLQYSSFYEFEAKQQNGSLNFIFTANVTEIAYARAAVPRMTVFYDATGAFWINKPLVNNTFVGLTLRSDYQAAWASLWITTIQPLVADGIVTGIWLGDEVGAEDAVCPPAKAFVWLIYGWGHVNVGLDIAITCYSLLSLNPYICTLCRYAGTASRTHSW
jgi:hypothetical protein